MWWPFVLSKVEAWTAYNILTRRVIEKSRSPFDKTQDERDFSRLNALFRLMHQMTADNFTAALNSLLSLTNADYRSKYASKKSINVVNLAG